MNKLDTRRMDIHALRDIAEGQMPEGHFSWPDDNQVVFISHEDARVVVAYDDHIEKPRAYEAMISRDLRNFLRCINLAYDADRRHTALWLNVA